MANKKFTDLPVAAAATMGDIYDVVQAGSSAQSTTQKLADLLGLGSGKVALNNADGSASFSNGNFLVFADGTIAFGTGAYQLNPDGSGFFSAGKILLNADGSVSFASGVASLGAGGGISGPTWTIGSDGTFNNGVAAINGVDGSATFASGNATIDVLGNLSAFSAVLNTVSVGGGATLSGLFSATAVLDFPNTLAQTSSDLTVTVTGAGLGDTVSIGVPNASVMANSSYSAWVSAADTVTIRFTNAGALPRDPASGTFRATVFKF